MKTRRLHTTLDPFAVFDLEPQMDVCPVELESRYLRLSRQCHPDYHTGGSPEEQAEAVQRAADANVAYRIVRDPWQRAECLAERAEPGVMERTKKLPQAFLLDAMELAEEVETTTAEPHRTDLRHRLTGEVDRYLERVRRALAEGHAEAAAVLLHEARYYRKALNDIDEPR